MSMAELLREILRNEKEPLKLINEFFQRESPMHRHLGLKITRLEEGIAEAVFEYNDRLTRVGGMIHGGNIMAAIDQVGGLAVLTVNDKTNQVTLELKINFTKPLTRDNSPYTVKARVRHRGSRTVVVDVTVEDKMGATAAVALGTWFML